MKRSEVIVLLLFSLLVVVFSTPIGLFWDNVLFASKMAEPLFVHGIFAWGSIPTEVNPGHPPFLAVLMAAGWTLFGKSLMVAHWLMLPFVFGLLWQLLRLVKFFVAQPAEQIFAFLLVLADPTLLSQLVLVNPEVVQLFFFFLALNALLRQNRWQKVLGLAFLGMVSYRGMMLCAGIFVIDFLYQVLVQKRAIKQFFSKSTLLSYALAALPALTYLLWAMATRGWIVSNPSENWGDAFGFASLSQFVSNFLRNLVVMGFQFMDFGRALPLLFVLFTLYTKRKIIDWKPVTALIVMVLFSTVIVYSTSLLIKNAMGHRYFLPSYLGIALLAFVLLKHYKAKRTLYLLLITSLVLGNFIVYPDRFAQGWDASLAHLPYWKLRKEALRHMDEHNMAIDQTASFFPNQVAIDNVDLNGDLRSFVPFSGQETYVFYSNVYNLSDDELELLHSNYKVVQMFQVGRVRVELLELRRRNTGKSSTAPKIIKVPA